MKIIASHLLFFAIYYLLIVMIDIKTGFRRYLCGKIGSIGKYNLTVILVTSVILAVAGFIDGTLIYPKIFGSILLACTLSLLIKHK